MAYRILRLLVLLLLNAVAPISKGQVIVIGGGTSGTAAALQAARMQVQVHLLEESSWLGGMLTSAGVSGTDGNHKMPSGIWGEFRDRIYQYYGGPDRVNTGWVSNTLFEPSVGAAIFRDLVAAEKNINVYYNSEWKDIRFENNRWIVSYLQDKKIKTVEGTILIDATELGDIAAFLKYPYYLGMDSRDRFGEKEAPERANDIVQDITYVAVLKDFGKGADKTIPRPKNYDSKLFHCACSHADPIGDEKPTLACDKMLSYARLPGDKYMLNWPNCGNDFYANVVELSKEDRLKAVEAARLLTLQFVYFIQHDLGYKQLGLTDDFPTRDKLPIMVYHRESRRFDAEAMLTLPYVADPYGQHEPLYRTGIAVGDYPIDHHHKKNPQAPTIDFIKIRVPAFNIPMGSLVPKGSTHLIVAEKSIGVSNIVNGATRLQPVVLGIGQAAGALAATAIRNGQTLQQTDMRSVQNALLDAGAMIMPFIDVDPKASWFKSVQRIGATGILKGEGVPYKWANQTWFYPDREISEYELVSGLRTLYRQFDTYWSASGQPASLEYLITVISMIRPDANPLAIRSKFETMSDADPAKLKRWQVAMLLDEFLNPFGVAVDWYGVIKNK